MGAEPLPSPHCISQNAARKIVPAFITLLYQMVSDKSNDDLIRWSKNGDSFFVRQPDRFAQEVLGKWFKHNNYLAFLRQLNNHGFKKVPHLQQGTLRSDGIHEHYHYTHSNFLLNRQDLLGYIQRKGQSIHNHPIRCPSQPASIPNIPSADDTSHYQSLRAQLESNSKLLKEMLAKLDELTELRRKTSCNS